jgi:hypothetical protein
MVYLLVDRSNTFVDELCRLVEARVHPTEALLAHASVHEAEPEVARGTLALASLRSRLETQSARLEQMRGDLAHRLTCSDPLHQHLAPSILQSPADNRFFSTFLRNTPSQLYVLACSLHPIHTSVVALHPDEQPGLLPCSCAALNGSHLSPTTVYLGRGDQTRSRRRPRVPLSGWEVAAQLPDDRAAQFARVIAQATTEELVYICQFHNQDYLSATMVFPGEEVQLPCGCTDASGGTLVGPGLYRTLRPSEGTQIGSTSSPPNLSVRTPEILTQGQERALSVIREARRHDEGVVQCLTHPEHFCLIGESGPQYGRDLLSCGCPAAEPGDHVTSQLVRVWDRGSGWH